MKHVIRHTHFWLFEKTNENTNIYYVRTMTQGLDKIAWFMGYENDFGLISSVGGELSEEKQIELETKFILTN